MKKLISVLMLVFSLTTQAEDWNPLTESIEGSKLIVDYDSIQFAEYYKDTNTKSWLIKANMYLVETNTPLVVAIDAKECILKNSGILVVTHDSETYSKYWTSTGNKVYDAQGIFLCHVTKKLLEAHESKANKVAI